MSGSTRTALRRRKESKMGGAEQAGIDGLHAEIADLRVKLEAAEGLLVDVQGLVPAGSPWSKRLDAILSEPRKAVENAELRAKLEAAEAEAKRIRAANRERTDRPTLPEMYGAGKFAAAESILAILSPGTPWMATTDATTAVTYAHTPGAASCTLSKPANAEGIASEGGSAPSAEAGPLPLDVKDCLGFYAAESSWENAPAPDPSEPEGEVPTEWDLGSYAREVYARYFPERKAGG
jgi:hypothetical protein